VKPIRHFGRKNETSVKPVYCLKRCAICDRVKSVVTIFVERHLSSAVVLMYAVCLDHVESKFYLIKFYCNEERRSCKFETALKHVIGCLLSTGCTLHASLHIPVTELRFRSQSLPGA
jgi:hypothetical protein